MERPFLKTPFIDFKNHINEEINQSILFSAPFGAGKSTFLNEFFKENEEFISIKLNPINYSVSANEDVFELIKFDIVFELLSKYQSILKLEEFKPKLIDAIIPFFNSHPKHGINFLSSILSFESKIGKPLAGLITQLFKTKEELDGFIKEISIDESNVLFNYLKGRASQIGSAYENDSITQLIYGLIQTIKEEEKKEIILLIDDLDRLDPDHTFRLFNIFSAHNQEALGEQENKFGFDKLIFVCDLNNIKNIFKYRYGSNVDFKGYINKFYSTEPFEFNIREVIKTDIENIISFLLSRLDSHAFGYFLETKSYKIALKTITLDLVQESLLHLRDMLHIQPITFIKPSNDFKNIINCEPTRILFRILFSFYGSWSKVDSVLKYLSKKSPRFVIPEEIPNPNNKEMDILGFAIHALISLDSNLFINDDYIFDYKEKRYTIKIKWINDRSKISLLKINEISLKENFSKNNHQILVYEVLYQAFQKIKVN